jgi:chromosome segregation ATPase
MINNIKEQNYKLEKESSKLKEKTKDLEEELDHCQEEKYGIEQKYKQLTFDYNRVKLKAEKLSEDIQVIETANQQSTRKPKVRRHISLMSELEEISKELVPEMPEPAFMMMSPKSLSLKVSNPVQVASVAGRKALNKRKNPLEEYFTLVIHN